MRWLLVLVLVACDDGADADGEADASPDGAVDAELPHDAQPDLAVDAQPDLAVDADPDLGGDAQPDVAVDMTVDAQPDGPPDPPGLRWNQGQARGTHNSTHVQPDVPVHPSHLYTQAPLSVQLEDQGVRQFELDIHRHVDGHFEVFHLPIVDAVTVCQRLAECLEEMRVWSQAHPRHFPVMVWVEPKDELDFVPPYERIAQAHYDDLDDELRAGLGERLFTPGELLGEHENLREAVAAGWPPLREMRGRFVFSMLDSGGHRDAYLADHPTLAARAMFVNSRGGDPFAALMKINNAVSDADEVAELAALGYVITSNVDSPEDSDEENARKRDGSLAAGAHYLSSDFPAPVEGRDYWMDMPDGAPVRCNPLTALEGCAATDLE